MTVMSELLVMLEQQKHISAPIRQGNKGRAFRGFSL